VFVCVFVYVDDVARAVEAVMLVNYLCQAWHLLRQQHSRPTCNAIYCWISIF